jgi:ubiquinone/menaquinone biosynthesis C-methylase UbiE
MVLTVSRSEKELAFLQDLFVASDWGERFAGLVDEHVQLPDEGYALYLAAETGSHAIALRERAGKKLKLLCIDENKECLDLARAKATAMKEQTEFRQGKLDALYLPDGQFDLVLGNASLLAPQRLPGMFSEMVRVVVPGGTIALSLPTASSFGEFFSIYWEALHNRGIADHQADVESLITELPTISELEQMFEQAGIGDVTSWSRIEEFDYVSGEEFLNSPLISDFLMKGWLQSLPKGSRKPVTQEIARIINEERHEGEFSLTVKATLVVGRKAKLPVAG